MTRRHRFQAAAALTCALAAAFALTVQPEGADAQRRGRGAAYLVQGRVPRNLSPRQLLSFGRSHRARTLRETTGVPLNQRRWLAKLIVDFGGPINDVEFTVLVFDVTDGRRNRRLATSMEMFVSDRSQRAFANNFRLNRPEFSPEQKLEIVVTRRLREVAKVQVELKGERRRGTGAVDFTQQDGPAP